jgi:hypothetical protein
MQLLKQVIRGKSILLGTILVLEWRKLLKKGKYNSKFLFHKFHNSKSVRVLMHYLVRILLIKHLKCMLVELKLYN